MEFCAAMVSGCSSSAKKACVRLKKAGPRHTDHLVSVFTIVPAKIQ